MKDEKRERSGRIQVSETQKLTERVNGRDEILEVESEYLSVSVLEVSLSLSLSLLFTSAAAEQSI